VIPIGRHDAKSCLSTGKVSQGSHRLPHSPQKNAVQLVEQVALHCFPACEEASLRSDSAYITVAGKVVLEEERH
jgi:hypothetical protein